jgi:hypothetical protein
MITAILLICTGIGAERFCTSVTSPEILYTTEECLISLSNGTTEAEFLGWTVVGYTCYNWDTQRTLDQFINDLPGSLH